MALGDTPSYLRGKRQAELRGPGETARQANTRSVSESRRRRKAVLDAFKRRPCTDCGGRFDPVCMDWDHSPSAKKSFTISRRQYGTDLMQLIDEMCKCDLVCSNCHRLRTKLRSVQ